MTSYGMTIQGLLGKDMLSLSMPDFKDDLKSAFSVKNFKNLGNTQGSDPTSAYLGPKLWDSTISLPFDLDPFGVSDIQDVLVENDIKVDYSPRGSPVSDMETITEAWLPVSPVSSPEENVERMQMPRASIFASTKDTLNTINTITRPKVEKKEIERGSIISRPTIVSPPLLEVKEEKSFLYAESKRAKLEREKEERRQRMEEDFSPEDLALATVPGYDFDPKERAFQLDELRPQPIIRKRKMVAVPEEHKDEKYWEKRLKNKEATRRSREAKRLKQNQIALRAAHLERENKTLRDQVEAAKRSSSELQDETEELKARLRAFEARFC
jgi:vacuolar-type H+-ATPase subunit I/STV1